MKTKLVRGRRGLLFLVTSLIVMAALPGTALGAGYNISVEPTSHLAGCVYRNEFQRGDQAVWLITITDPATGAGVSEGISVAVRVGEKELNARYNERQGLWAASLPLTWDFPTGTLNQSVAVTDARGRVTEWRPTYAGNQSIVVVPGPIAVASEVVDPVAGEPVLELHRGDTVRIVAQVSRPFTADGLFVLTKPERELTLPDKGEPLSEGVTVKALIGQGSFIPSTGEFSGGNGTEVPLAFDAARDAWTATYTIPEDAGQGSYTVAVIAEDPHGNRGTAIAATAKLVIPPVKPGPLDGPRGMYAGLLVAVVGLAAGLLLAARRGGRRVATA